MTPSRRAASRLYAIAAPASSFDARRRDLVRVLDSFSFAEVSKSSSEPSQTAVSYKTFRDPSEGAFTVEVPVGWGASGGAVRRSAVEVYPRLELRSPNGEVRVFMGGDDLRTYALPNPTLAASGFPEGSEYSPGYGVVYAAASPGPGDWYKSPDTAAGADTAARAALPGGCPIAA